MFASVNSMSPVSLVSKLSEEFSEVINSIRDPEQKSMAVELLNQFPVSNSTCEIYEETLLKICARIGDVAEELVRAIIKQKQISLEDVGSLLHSNSKRRTALHVASENGSIRIAKLLLDSGANVDCQDLDKRTPLHLAALNKQKDSIILLLNHGAKRDATDMDEKTPMDLLSQPIYNSELSNFKTTEVESDDVEVQPKRGRPRKAKNEVPVQQSTMQNPQQHSANMFYHPDQPNQMVNQAQQIQYVYCIVTDPSGFQYAQPMPVLPYGQNPMGIPAMNAPIYGNQPFPYVPTQMPLNQQFQPVYGFDHSANQQSSAQANFPVVNRQMASPIFNRQMTSPIPNVNQQMASSSIVPIPKSSNASSIAQIPKSSDVQNSSIQNSSIDYSKSHNSSMGYSESHNSSMGYSESQQSSFSNDQVFETSTNHQLKSNVLSSKPLNLSRISIPAKKPEQAQKIYTFQSTNDVQSPEQSEEQESYDFSITDFQF